MNLNKAISGFFKNTGFRSQGYLNFTPRQAYIEFTEGGAILVDVREPEYYAFKCIEVPETICMPLEQLKTDYINLPQNKGLILVDSTGLHSKEALVLLTEKGFNNIANLAGGVVEWERDGMPLKENIEERLSGSCMCQLRPRNKKIN